MYSHGSSGRVGGKRGHGGGNYRTPTPRKDPNTVPPPLKQCDCLVELDIVEYAQPEPTGRRHESFLRGREGLQECTKILRGVYCCHFEVPGRTKGGPLGVVGKSLAHVVPACHYVMNCLHQEADCTARIHPSVKQSLPPIRGRFHTVSVIGVLFESSPQWAVAACVLSPPDRTLEQLHARIEDLRFRDSQFEIEIYPDPAQKAIFASGTQNRIQKLINIS